MRYALVTGGSRGLGRAICLRIARMGIPVIINYQSNEAAAEETLRLVEAEGGSAELARFDVRVKEEVEAALARWEAAHPDANIIFGAAFDDTMDDEIRVTVIATRFDEKPTNYKPPERQSAGLFTEASEKKEAAAESPEKKDEPKEAPPEEDPFDTIFKIFNNK